jgi:hypothetical protein
MSKSDTLWAEDIEKASAKERAGMGFGPFHVEPEGHLGLFLEAIDRTPKPGAVVPGRWPVGRAPGWQELPINEEWSLSIWCALGGEWVLQSIDSSRKIQVHVSDSLSGDDKAHICERLHEPLELLTSGEAFAFCGRLFILPDDPFVMNSFTFHPQGHEPLDVFVGFRGHTQPYPEVITPSVFRAINNPSDESRNLYARKARVGSNVVKQIMYEAENVVLTEVQARGILQHYGIIGPTDILDLSYDVNIAKWFSLNIWDKQRRAYTPKIFREHQDEGKGHDECSVIYTVIVRVMMIHFDPVVMPVISDFLRRAHVTLMPWAISGA